MKSTLSRTLCLLAVLSLPAFVPRAFAADRPAGLLGKVAMTLAARALESRNPQLMSDVAQLLEARVFEKIGTRSGAPWDLAALKREMALEAMSEEGAAVRDPLSRIMNHPALTALFPVFTGEVPIGSAQVGRIGATLALHALKTPDPALKAAMGRILAGHALEQATRDKDAIWDLRELKGMLSMWAMSPEAEALRSDVSLVLSNAQAMATLFAVFQP